MGHGASIDNQPPTSTNGDSMQVHKFFAIFAGLFTSTLTNVIAIITHAHVRAMQPHHA